MHFNITGFSEENWQKANVNRKTPFSNFIELQNMATMMLRVLLILSVIIYNKYNVSYRNLKVLLNIHTRKEKKKASGNLGNVRNLQKVM
jgi:hypothetical protein